MYKGFDERKAVDASNRRAIASLDSKIVYTLKAIAPFRLLMEFLSERNVPGKRNNKITDNWIINQGISYL